MTKFIGRLLEFGVGQEAARGSVANPQYRVPITSFSFDDKIVQARSVGGLGNLADSEESFVTTKYGQGDVEGEIRSQSFGLFLWAMLGGYSAGSIADSSYTHSFTVSQSNQHKSLTFTVKDENSKEAFPRVMLDSLEINAELDQIIMFTSSFMSEVSAVSTKTIPPVVTEYKFTKKHIALKLASAISGFGAVSAISLKAFSIKFSNNVFLDDVLGSVTPEDILNRQLSVEGSLTLNYEGETYKDYMLDGTNKAMQLVLTNSDETIGSGATNPSLKLQMPKVDFFDWEPAYVLDEIVTQTISFKASYSVSTAQQIVHLCQLVNGIETYDFSPSISPSMSPSPSPSFSPSTSPSVSLSPSFSSSFSPSVSTSVSPSPA